MRERMKAALEVVTGHVSFGRIGFDLLFVQPFRCAYCKRNAKRQYGSWKCMETCGL